jgi:hypothetical protein
MGLHRPSGGIFPMKTVTAIAALAATLLASAPSFAEDAKSEARSERAPVVKPESRRPTTVERWRGGPYLRSGSYNDALIRHEALDKSIPVITTSPNFTTPSF